MTLALNTRASRGLLAGGALALMLALPWAACERRKVDGCERLFEQRRRCLSVYQGQKEFVYRCRKAGMKPGLVHQIRCARKPSCAAFRKCLQRAQPRQPSGRAPELYRSLRPAPRPTAPR